MEAAHCGDHGGCIFEIRHRGRRQQPRDVDNIVEGDRHAAARERVPHVHCVAEDDHARGLLRRGWEERVGHAAELASFEGAAERGLHGWRQRGERHVEHVVLDAAGFYAR